MRVVSENHVLWAGPPDRYEAGTPAIMNIIIFARALQIKKQDPEAFKQKSGKEFDLLEKMGNPSPPKCGWSAAGMAQTDVGWTQRSGSHRERLATLHQPG